MNLKHILIAVVVMFLFLPDLYAQMFEAKELNGVLYQRLQNEGTDGGRPALVVFLHGRSGSGSDNLAQMNYPGVNRIASYLKKSGMSAIFLVPQCPSDMEWAPRNGKPGYNEKLFGLISHCILSEGVDTARIYLCGVSMGACGVWDLIGRHPGLFAAAIIGSGFVEGVSVSNLVNTPLYVSAGTDERSHGPLRSLSDSVNENGGHAEFTAFRGLQHREACDKAVSKKRLEGMFSHRKQGRVKTSLF